MSGICGVRPSQKSTCTQYAPHFRGHMHGMCLMLQIFLRAQVMSCDDFES